MIWVCFRLQGHGSLLRSTSEIWVSSSTVTCPMSMYTHVRTTIRNCSLHLCQLRLVRHSLSKKAVHALVRAMIHGRLDYCNSVLLNQPMYVYNILYDNALVRAMIHCRLDYCNSVLSNQPMYVCNYLQSVLRTAARLVMRLLGYASVTEVLKKDLHWLGFPQQISYEMCTLTYSPEYLTRHFILVSSVDGRSHLRSAAAGHLVVLTTKKNNGNKKFPLFGTCSLEQSSPSIA